jgi:integrase
MNTLKSALQRYVSLRRGFGFKFLIQEKRLQGFVRFMEERDAPVITNKLALEWATQFPKACPSCTLRLTDVRGFARYLSVFESRTEVPPTRILPGLSRAKPYLYTEKEITHLLSAALRLRPADGLRRWTYHHLLGLLSVTGLRISELISLRREDVDLDENILTVRDSKFGKSRLVPLHTTTGDALRCYAKRRDAHIRPPHSPFFFVTDYGEKLELRYVENTFRLLCRHTGLRAPADHTGPRLHDFRHRFAVQVLLTWYRSGQNVELLLPVLSTYLGHSRVCYTYWYLSACPELMGQAARRLEKRWESST